MGVIFEHTMPQVKNKDKTQSRRLTKPGEGFEYMYPGSTIRHVAIIGEDMPQGEYTITAVFTASGREKWRAGKTYAAMPGRGQGAVAFIRIIGIRKERLQDINPEDIVAEGVLCDVDHDPLDIAFNEWQWNQDVFSSLWDEIHTKPGTRWNDNPLVWVLEFELVENSYVGSEEQREETNTQKTNS